MDFCLNNYFYLVDLILFATRKLSFGSRCILKRWWFSDNTSNYAGRSVRKLHSHWWQPEWVGYILCSI